MNPERLREAEGLFFAMYPEAFESEALKAVVRRHNVGRLIDLAAAALARGRFARPAPLLDDIVRIVTRSSMVSLFEKPRFRDWVQGLGRVDRARLAGAFERLLHGVGEVEQASGFADLVDLLTVAGLAKWSLVTVCPFYLRPTHDVFVKPTTTKNIIRQFELEHLVYRPRPSWSFYSEYRAAIAAMKDLVHPALAPNNAAFTGFLMMTSAVGERD